LEVNPNFNQEKSIGVPESVFAIKGQRDDYRNTTEFIYFLGIPDKVKLEKKLEAGELIKYMIKNQTASYGRVRI
jgi:hypothetical protein